MRLLTALLLPALLHAALRGTTEKKDESLMDLMKDTLEESVDAHPAVETHIETDRNGNQVKIEEQTNEDGTWVITASDVKDATAHAVDQTLVGKAEEDLAAKEQGDPLLADPLLSLEQDHEGEEDIDNALEDLDKNMQDEEERLFFDPKLFKEDTVAQMDTNNDGFLDEDELKKHLTKAIDAVRQDELAKQQEVNADGVKEIMEMMDDNGDGKLSKEEMFGKTTQTAKQKEADNRMFDFADGQFGNKDGLLDAEEVFIMALPQYSADRKAWYQFKARDHMEEMDTDNDHEVSWKEYKDAMDLVKEEGDGDEQDEMSDEDKKALFDKADANSDKKLDTKELSKLVELMENKNMEDTVQELIKLADDNKDGKLALAEIINHVSDFGGQMGFFLNDPDLLFTSSKRLKSAGDGKHMGDLHHAPKKLFVTKALLKNAAHHGYEDRLSYQFMSQEEKHVHGKHKLKEGFQLGEHGATFLPQTEPFWEKGMAAYKKIYSENGGKDHDLSALGERENPKARFGASVTQNGGD